MIIPEKRVCDFCGAENPEHQATYLTVNTSCEWTEGRSTEPRIEMQQYDICEKCLLAATNIYADFQGFDSRIVRPGRIIRRGEKNNG